MPFRRLNRRDFVRIAGTAGLAATLAAGSVKASARSAANPAGELAIPDGGWRLWVDEKAPWENDEIFLPQDVALAGLAAHPPTGGWEVLDASQGNEVTLPATVEQFHWGEFGLQPYTRSEYSWAHRDSVPQNGAYRGVSWWWREIDIPATFKGRRLILTVRGARLRAEVFLNQKLVGYSIMEELPFDCDVTAAANPGGRNVLAIRITNPGGRYDWLDGDTLTWGKVKIQSSHGFGGLDRGLKLATHPMDGRIADLWVLNTPKRRTVNAYVKFQDLREEPGKNLVLDVLDEQTGRVIAAHIAPAGRRADGAYGFAITAPKAALWSLTSPNLYRLRAHWQSPHGGESVREVVFGFRWFGVDGLGGDALFRLNGRRIKIYSAISWGYWGFNGLWPTPELAEKEVSQAKALGLNCLNFHRNVGKEEVFHAQDRQGLLRVMEPGGGKFALGKLPDGAKVDAPSVIMEPPKTEADLFCQRHMVAKCVGMVRAFRSHPSLIQYTLQNEVGADLNNPDTVAALNAMRAEDESRVIVLNDGFVATAANPDEAWYHRAAQAWYAPYDPRIHRSDKEPWGGWWSDHQGAGDQWYDEFYRDPEHFNYRQSLAPAIVQFGEMEGCAVPDNHVRMIAEILHNGGSSYDLEDHREILAGYETFLDRWNFRKSFPTAESLFLAIGRKSYESWQQYLENARINDATDFAAISGWESTSIENHSGLVDNLRNFKCDPEIVRGSLLPVRPVAKQRSMTVAMGESAVFDLYLLNDTGRPVSGNLVLSMTNPLGRKTQIAAVAAPAFHPDQFSALIKEAVSTPPLLHEGAYKFEFSLSGMPHATHVREIWVADTKRAPRGAKTVRIGLANASPALRDQLRSLPGVDVSPFEAGQPCDVVVASGTPGESGELPPKVLAVAKGGTPLLVIAQEDVLADGFGKQLAAEGAFTYEGQVGRLLAPWMGNWYFVREHEVYAGLPTGRAMAGHYQAHGKTANGLVIDGPNVDVFVGYSRDHDRRVGAGTFTAKLGAGKLLFQRVPDFSAPLQQRFLSNAFSWLCG